METLFFCVVVFLFLLAVFDLSVGVSNDAVNFMNSAIGSRAASFRQVLVVASAGVFIGAAMTGGMMDIARHGIFRPEHFSFYELTCIFMAVMVTDIILLDIFQLAGHANLDHGVNGVRAAGRGLRGGPDQDDGRRGRPRVQ